MRRVLLLPIVLLACSKSSDSSSASGSAKAPTPASAAGSATASASASAEQAPPDAAPLPPPDWSKAAGYTAKTIALPGATADGVFMDYLLYDARTKAVFVPAGNTGAVDVIDTSDDSVKQITGFPTQEMERHGKKRVVGPSSATLGPDGTVYVGNRGDFSVCAIDEKALTKGTCGTLDSMPDGIAYVAKTGEVWVTTPRDQTIRILDAKTLAQKAKLQFQGDPEGFAVDATRGRFYTNMEDKDQTLAIDLASHQTVATWQPNCGEEGPHGLRLDEKDGFLFIACSKQAEVMDVGHGGAILGTIPTGDGNDDLDWSNGKIYAGGAATATLTIASVDAKGALTFFASVPTPQGSRNGVAAANGKVYLSHSKGGELVVAVPPAK
jgi:DNA-binding beta-propeller fold protein YncE